MTFKELTKIMGPMTVAMGRVYVRNKEFELTTPIPVGEFLFLIRYAKGVRVL